MMFHELPPVRRFHAAHSRYLDPRVRSKFGEKYEIGCVCSRARPVLSLLIGWAGELLKDSRANGAIDQLHDAMHHVDNNGFNEAAEALQSATYKIMREIEYDRLSLVELSSIAWLGSELADLGDRLGALRDKYYSELVYISVGRDQWVRLSRGEGDLFALVPILAALYCEHGKWLCLPKDTTADALLKELEDGPHLPFLTGFAVACWAATHGHLVALNDAILSTMASWGIELGNTVDKIVPKKSANA